MRTSLTLSIILMGVIGMVFALVTGSVYRELALDNQRSALANMINLKVKDLLGGLEGKSRELGSDLLSEPAFRASFDSRNHKHVISLLNNQFHRYYQTANIIRLEKLFLFDANYSLFAESSEGATDIGKFDMICGDLWLYPDLTDTSLRVIIHSEVANAKAKKIQSGIQTGSRPTCSAI